MNIFGRGKRKALYLSSTILRGRVAKDDNEQGGATGDDGIEVGAGFASAADKMAGDDNRDPEQRGKGATQDIPDDAGKDDGADADKSGGADGGAAPDQGNEDGEGDGDDQNRDDTPDGEDGQEGDKPKPKKRDTAAYIRDLKRENRQLKTGLQTIEQRIAAMENRGSTTPQGGDNSADTSERPDPSDATKYPLGVLDDGFITDMIEWTADQKVAKALNGRLQTEKEQAEEARVTEHLTNLRSKADLLTEAGADQFDDFETLVVEGGLKGDWQLTETTFTAAADADNGPAILYALAKDKAEALRVSQLSPFQQLKYVAEKDAEITAAKPKARHKPRAATPPPSNAPAGRNSSSPIRADTDNLDDFRKLYYK